MIYTPFTDDGSLAGNLHIALTTTEKYRCETSRVADRPDAYRCFIRGRDPRGGNIEDPCFQYLGSALICVGKPTDTQVVKVRPSRLPKTDVPFDHQPTQGAPWVLQLTDGQECVFLAGASVAVAGLRENYFCKDGRRLFGLPDRSTPTWTIFSRTKSDSSLVQAGVSLAWF